MNTTSNDILTALKLARKYLAKMIADDVNTAISPRKALECLDAVITKTEKN
jgi:hypothetical protein